MKARLPSSLLIEEGNLGVYLRDISRYGPLSSADEREMAIRIRKGDKRALDRLVKSNLRFVVSVARNYQNQGMTLVDLINEGNLGLIKAAMRFDEGKNFKFISYAVWWIRQAILQGLADHSRIVKIPLNRVATIHRVGKARIALEQKLGHTPGIAEIAEELGIPEEDVASSLQIGRSHASLDAPIGDDSSGSLIDIISDDNAVSTDDVSMADARTNEVERLMSLLGSREEEVLRLYFGIGEDTAYTLEEIGIRTGITRERVRQIKDTAIAKLRKHHRAKELWEFLD